jgi:hypothetical protein
VQPSWSEGGTTRHNFGRGPSNDYFIKVWFQLSNWFQTRRFLCEFPIGSYVKLSSAVVAILVGGMKCQTQFWKGATQGSFQQSLVEIGSVVSEEKILKIFHPPFLFLAWQPSWLEVGITGHNFGRGPSKDHSTKVVFQLALWFLRRRILCEFPIGSYVRLWGPSWSKGRTARHIFGREPSNDFFIKILFLLSKWFQTRRFLWEFPIGSYVKLSSAVVAILVGVLKYRTQIWKRTTQESFQQSLVEIGSVVSEEKNFF